MEERFTKTLKSLVTNDKYIINTLSIMAKDAKDDPIVAKCITEIAILNIYKVSGIQKLYNFYVIDSIIKNIGQPYKELFSKKIVDAFVHTFQSNKEPEIRSKLYNLRITWKPQFPLDLMAKLDEMIKKYDPAWPLVTLCDPKAKQNLDKKTSESSSAKSSPDSTTPSCAKDLKSDSESKKRKSETSIELDLFTIDRTGDNKIKKRIIEESKPIKNEPTEFIGKNDLDLRIPQENKVETKVSNENWTSDDIFRYLNKKTDKTSRENTPPVTNRFQVFPNISMPREPTWKILIEGFPQFPQIGTDPRLLCHCPFYDPTRSITIDGTKYLLHLDRIQPCIFVNKELHAVRFYCQSIEIHINNVPYELSSIRLTHIKINRRAYVACLGGPGHELIINGWPYNVRIDGNIHQISVSGFSVTVQFLIHRQIQVNVQNAIPPYICDWAEQGFFGSPQYLNMPPLNPLRNNKLNDDQAFRFRYELNVMHFHRMPHHQPGYMNPRPHDSSIVNSSMPPPSTVKMPSQNQTNTEINPTVNSQINVHDLFQKLLATGIISPNKSKDLKIDVTKYSWDVFKVANEKEINEMCSGHQCDLCGTRFKNKESKEFELHLDYHFYKNTAKFTINKVSRNYFAGSRQWVIGSSVRTVEPDFDFEQTINIEQKFKCPAFEDNELNKCAVCLEGFVITWDDEEEKDMLLDGQLYNGKAYHPICLEDADKQIEEAMIDENIKQINAIVKEPLTALQKVLSGSNLDCLLDKETVERVDQSDQDTAAADQIISEVCTNDVINSLVDTSNDTTKSKPAEFDYESASTVSENLIS